MRTNFVGTLSMSRAFAPVLERNGGGAIVNLLSLVVFGSVRPIGGYSASKAAAASITQALRAQLADRGIAVHGVFPGAIDTDMIRNFQIPKSSAPDVAAAILDGVAAGQSNIFSRSDVAVGVSRLARRSRGLRAPDVVDLGSLRDPFLVAAHRLEAERLIELLSHSCRLQGRGSRAPALRIGEHVFHQGTCEASSPPPRHRADRIDPTVAPVQVTPGAGHRHGVVHHHPPRQAWFTWSGGPRSVEGNWLYLARPASAIDVRTTPSWTGAPAVGRCMTSVVVSRRTADSALRPGRSGW